MSNSLLTPTVIAKRAMMNLDNDLVMGNLVYRDYEKEFGPTKIGDTVTIRRPIDFTVTDGATLNLQDVTEGSLTMQISKQKHIGFSFSAADRTMTIDEFDKRYIKPAAIQLANQIDVDLANLYKDINNWAGTPGQTINSHSDFLKGVERLDVLAVPSDQRAAILSPNDWHGLAGTFSGLYIGGVNKDALTVGVLPDIGGASVYKTNNIPNHTVGAYGSVPVVNGASQSSTYASVKTTMTQTLNTKTWTTNKALKQGDVFTIYNVFDVNPVTKATLDHNKQFVLTADVTTNTTTSSNTTLTIYPAIITSGPYQNVSAVPADGATITYLGTLSTGYRQNMLFHKNAFALAMVPYEQASPGSGVAQSTQRHKGLAMTYTEFFDGINFKHVARLDVMYGVKTVDARLATRLSGSA